MRGPRHRRARPRCASRRPDRRQRHGLRALVHRRAARDDHERQARSRTRPEHPRRPRASLWARPARTAARRSDDRRQPACSRPRGVRRHGEGDPELRRRRTIFRLGRGAALDRNADPGGGPILRRSGTLCSESSRSRRSRCREAVAVFGSWPRRPDRISHPQPHRRPAAQHGGAQKNSDQVRAGKDRGHDCRLSLDPASRHLYAGRQQHPHPFPDPGQPASRATSRNWSSARETYSACPRSELEGRMR